MDNVVVIAVVAVVLLIIWVIARTAVVVPQQSAYVVETVGPLQPHALRPASTCSSRSSTGSPTGTR